MRAESVQMNPELALVLCCARTHLDETLVARRDLLLQEDLDWARILHLVSVHRLIPLVFRNLTSVRDGSVPGRVVAQLQAEYREAIDHNLFLTAELLSLLKLFSANGLSMLPYKGPVLGEILYGSVCLRQFGDLDILVPKNQVLEATELLVQDGYRLEWPDVPLTPDRTQDHLETKYNYQLVRRDGRVTVELHWSILPRYFSFPPHTEWLWRDLVETHVCGQKTRSFTSADWLLILCAHGANHCWNRLSWICDVAELLRRFPDLDANRLDTQATELGCRRMLHLGLLLARDLLEAPVPASLHDCAMADQPACTLADEILERCNSTTRYVPRVLEVPRFHIRVHERLSDRARYCRALVVPSVEDWRVVRLPGFLSFFYYLLRPLRLLREYILSPFWSHLKRRLGAR